MSGPAPEAPRIGSAEQLKPFRRVDSRICTRCGARAGQCRHMSDETDIIWLSYRDGYKFNPQNTWIASDRQKVVDLYNRGLSQKQIAEVMNTTTSAISGILHRMRARKCHRTL